MCNIQSKITNHAKKQENGTQSEENKTINRPRNKIYDKT